MTYIVAGSMLMLFLILDIVWTTLTTRGEGPISACVSGGFRKVSRLVMRNGYRLSEIVGSTSLMTLGTVWLLGLWAGMVLVFFGMSNPVSHSHRAPIETHDLVYYIGFTLSTLGVGDIAPNSTAAQLATAVASFIGLLVVTLIVTYAVSVVSAVVARRVLAYEIYLAGEDSDDFLANFADVDDFSGWVGSINRNLIYCTEQRLAYPILDNFVAKEARYSLSVQLARLGLVAHNARKIDRVSNASVRNLNNLFSILFRYTSLAGITGEDLASRLQRLEVLEGSP